MISETSQKPAVKHYVNPAHEVHDDEDIGLPPPAPRPGRPALLALVATVAVVFAALFLLGWIPLARRQATLRVEADAIKASLPRVQVMHPRPSPPVAEALLPGDVQALEETNVYARINGYLKHWLVDIGDEVEEGQLLAEIATPEVDQELRQSKATLGQLKARQITAESTAHLAEISLKRYEILLPKAAISQQEVDERRAAFETASSAVDAAKADVAAGEANVQRLVETQAFSKVYAPFAGTITARNIEIGHLVAAGTSQAFYRLAKTNPVRVFVNVPQMYSRGVTAGLEAQLVVREMPGRKFIGKVTRTARAIDPNTRTLLTEIQVPNEDHALLTGSYVQVRLQVARENPPLLIPASALTFNADGTRVALVDAQRHIHFQPVVVEGDFGSEVGISSGLTPEVSTVINPGERLTEGGQVQVDPPHENPTAVPVRQP